MLNMISIMLGVSNLEVWILPGVAILVIFWIMVCGVKPQKYHFLFFIS